MPANHPLSKSSSSSWSPTTPRPRHLGPTGPTK